MDIEEIKTLTDLMVEHDLSEIIIRDGEKRILLRRGALGAGGLAAPVVAMTHHSPAPAPVAPPPSAPPSAPTADTGLAKITSPMVGTFYATPDPESPAFVKVGDRVNPDTVVCIIEAMKVFNEIKAEISGTIESIEVQSGRPVEFGQVLMTVRVA
ncbi:MAG: acetyl-CoA carboxylase biotin carboxyl carrier protein [Planctomycetota bacterium]|nr:MAG: acetyl-CoA carboxylase biotin carboxyl carrier protein [Planctomycetota bacterium]